MFHTVALAVVAGVVFGLFGFWSKGYDPDGAREDFNWKKFAKTILLYGAAGGILGASGTTVTLEATQELVNSSALIIALGEIFERLWSRLVSNGPIGPLLRQGL